MFPWAEWLDGREWHLIRGRDFWGPPELFRRRIQASANARSVKVEIQIDEHRRFIHVKAVTDDPVDS